MGDELLMHGGWVHLDDPIRSYPPTAQRLLGAAQRILDRDGFPGLSLQRIADEADEHKSLIAYHFGGKDGLIEVLADAAWHDDNVGLLRHLRKHPPGSEPMVERLMDVHRRLARDEVSYKRFFELFPYVIRDKGLRQRLARLYEWYRDIDALYLRGSGQPEASLAALCLAVLDGMAVLLLADPTGVDSDRVFDFWSDLLESGLSSDSPSLVCRGVRTAGSASNSAAPRDPITELATSAASGDPAAVLAPVGRRLLVAAQKVLRRRGLAAVTLDAVAAAAGEPRSAVWYYFGDKRTLLRALVDARGHRVQAAYIRQLRRLPGGSGRVAGMIGAERTMLRGLSDFAVFFELLPAIVRDAELREREARFQAWRRTYMLYCLFGLARPQDELQDLLATLCAAVTYGLSVQLLLDPKPMLAWQALDIWSDLLIGAAGPADAPFESLGSGEPRVVPELLGPQ